MYIIIVNDKIWCPPEALNRYMTWVMGEGSSMIDYMIEKFNSQSTTAKTLEGIAAVAGAFYLGNRIRKWTKEADNIVAAYAQGQAKGEKETEERFAAAAAAALK